MTHRPFTPAEDQAIIANYATLQLKEIAATLGRSWTVIQQRRDYLARHGLLDKTQRAYNREWSEDDLEYLANHWGAKADATMATHLRRTVVACELKAKRLGLNRHMAVLTARDVGRIFGVDAKTILTWVKRGWLKGKRAGFVQGQYRVWNFETEANRLHQQSIEAFIRAMPWAFDLALMPKGDYHTNLAKDVLAADPWLTSEEAAKVAGVHVNTLQRWTRCEELPCQHRPKLGTHHGPWQGLIVIRKADLVTWLATHRAQEHRNRSASAKRRRARELGKAA